MKKFFGALLLLPVLVLVMAQFASAQDAMSVILPSPYNSRVGSQLLYFFEDGAASRTGSTFLSYLTITNTSIDTYVAIHYQYYLPDCSEHFNYVDILTPGQTYVITPSKVMTTKLNRQGQQVRGYATDNRYLMTATAIDASKYPANHQAIAFNYLTGQIFITNVGKGSTWGTNAIARMAVDALGAPLPASSCPINFNMTQQGQMVPYAIGQIAPIPAGCVAGHTLLGPTNGKWLQMYRPNLLYVNHFFEPLAVDQIDAAKSAFGNRLTMVAFKDNYQTATMWFKIETDTSSVTSFVFDNYENALSVPQRDIKCLTEWTISPRGVAGTAANQWYVSSKDGQVGGDFLSLAFVEHVQLGGWLRMSVTAIGSAQGSLFGWISQALAAYGNGDLLIGEGRKDSNGLLRTDSNITATGSPILISVLAGAAETQ